MLRKKKIKARSRPGNLIIIGGREDKQDERRILRAVVERTGTGALVVATVASSVALDLWDEYESIFRSLGIKHINHLHIEQAEDSRKEENIKLFDKAKTVFFTGGDQLKITSKLGGSPLVQKILDVYHSGGTLAGTSAGAAIMGETMLVGGENAESHKVGNWMMAPGLGFVKNVIIDQHFAQRGRIGRLLGAVALNPGVLGVGVDEDTAVIVDGDILKVIGTNAVYVVDGTSVSYTNISEAAAEKTMSMHNVKLHILSQGEEFNLATRVACANNGKIESPKK